MRYVTIEDTPNFCAGTCVTLTLGPHEKRGTDPFGTILHVVQHVPADLQPPQTGTACVELLLFTHKSCCATTAVLCNDSSRNYWDG